MEDSNGGIDVPMLREVMEQSEKSHVEELGPPDDQLEESYYDITLPDSHQIKSKVFRRKNTSSSARPLILLFHGGGFAAGSCEMCTRPGREFALEFDAVVVSSAYRLAPEYKFPQAVLDGIEVVKWLVSNAEQALGANPKSGLIVGGYSAGAQIAAVVAREINTMDLSVKISGSFLCIQGLFEENTVPAKYKSIWNSRDENDSHAPG